MADPYEGWAIVELMGHRRLAGKVSETEQYGTRMLRLDIYADGASEPSATQFYGGGAVYCLTPAAEETARQVGTRSLAAAAPVARFELEARRAQDDPDDGPYEDPF